MKNPRAVSAVTQQIAEQVYAHAREGRCVLTLGGDHSIAVGTIAGTSRAVREGKIGGGAGSGRGSGEIGVIWIDAHADINTPETSESGNIHGMPVAWLTGLAQRSGVETKGNGDALKSEGQEEEENEVFGWLDKTSQSQQARTNGVVNGISSDKQNGAASKPMLNLKKLVYIGLRDVDRAEKEILRKEGIKAFSMHDIDRCVVFIHLYVSALFFHTPISPAINQHPPNGIASRADISSSHGIGRITDLALAHLGPNTPIHLSFDVDALDPQWAPSTGTPVRGGLTLREGDFIAECVHQTGQLVAMDLVEVNPRLQPGPGEEETVRAGVSLVRCALGDQLL